VELEQKFVDLAGQNYALHAKKWAKLGSPQPIMFQGDSRHLSDVIARADCVVGSPPFQGGHSGTTDENSLRPPHDSKNNIQSGYGDSPGQLGSMKPGSVEAIRARRQRSPEPSG
jgi:hypothetical protein